MLKSLFGLSEAKEPQQLALGIRRITGRLQWDDDTGTDYIKDILDNKNTLANYDCYVLIYEGINGKLDNFEHIFNAIRPCLLR